MAQPPSAHLRNPGSAGRHHRRKGEGGLVTHAARAVLIHLDSLNSRQIKHLAALGHGHGKPEGFLLIHAPEIDRHHQGGYLVIGNLSPYIAVDDESDFFLRQRTTISLFHDQVIHPHDNSSLHPSNRVICDRAHSH